MTQRLRLFVILAAVGALAWFARDEKHRRVELAGRSGWVTTDPDSLYQMRRVERALAEGVVAETDPLMNAPHGAAIPWPPYYTRVLATVLAPFAPGDVKERHAWIEMRVGSVAIVCSVLATLLAALAARRIAGDGAALIAGVLHALCGAAVAYGASGNGDHHALVSLVAGAMLFVASEAFREESLASRGRSLALGVALGLLAGFALGVWVASLVYVVQLQLALGWLVLQHARKPRPGVAVFGLAFHATAIAAVLPAVLSSPWRAENPWFVVNLSWFHPAWLAAGALVFAPLFALRESSRALRAWPWLVAGVLAVVALALGLGDSAPARGIREGFAWASRDDEFMAVVGESRSLIGAGSGTALFEALGYGVLLAPLAWGWLAWRAFVCKRNELVPWAVAFPLLAWQALEQARFAEALAVPLAVVLAWAAAQLASRAHVARARVALLASGVLLAFAAQWPCASSVVERWRESLDANSRERPAAVGTRMASEWLRRSVPLEPAPVVLASWGAGHALEWAGCASVATNFGAYVGDEGFRTPARFFMSEDADTAIGLLDMRGARYVLVDSDLPNALSSLIALSDPSRRERYVDSSSGGGGVKPEWCATMGARLLFDGRGCGAFGESARPLDRLRLVWASPLRDPTRTLRHANDFAHAAVLWERVKGAEVQARGAPGDELTLEIHLRLPRAGRELVWRDTVSANAHGIAILRVPYATDQPNGEARADGAARWTFGSRSGRVTISSSAVLAGAVIQVD